MTNEMGGLVVGFGWGLAGIAMIWLSAQCNESGWRKFEWYLISGATAAIFNFFICLGAWVIWRGFNLGGFGSSVTWALLTVCINFARNHTSAVSGAASDVRTDAAMSKKLAKPFIPEKYIDIQKGIFMGLDVNRKPVYLPRVVLDKNHIDLLGESGVGKSSLAGVLLSQLAAAGETVVIFDPKNDRNLPGALARAGAEWGKYPVRVLDLRPQANFAQVNPFENCRPDQVEELLQVALELGKSGDAGVDFHRGEDREAAGFLSEAMADGHTSMLELIEKASQDERVTSQKNFWRELRQIGRLKAFHTESGLDLEAVINDPGVLYIIGSTTRLEVVAGQKLLLQRVLQILDERADADASRPVTLFLDELKFLLSPAALRAAGTIRDRNCHLLFAHQSLGDLDDCPGLSPKAVRGAIWGNCGIKIVYKVPDSLTAKELEAVAGQTSVVATSHSQNDQGESYSTRIEKGTYMPAHIFTHLPKPVNGEASVGVVFGLGPAWYLSTRYIETGPAPQPVPAQPEFGRTAPLAPDTPPAPPAGVRCCRCGEAIAPGAAYCTECGAAIPEAEADDLADLMKR